MRQKEHIERENTNKTHTTMKQTFYICLMAICLLTTAKTTIKGIYELRLTDDIRPDVDIEEDATWTLSASIKEEEPVQKNIIFKVNDNTTFGLKRLNHLERTKRLRLHLRMAELVQLTLCFHLCLS